MMQENKVWFGKAWTKERGNHCEHSHKKNNVWFGKARWSHDAVERESLVSSTCLLRLKKNNVESILVK
jgi:hypothetical protein